MTAQVVVFLDWQNVYESARESFHTPESPSFCGQIDPLGLGLEIAAALPDSELKQVRVYRGLPSNDKDPKGYGAVRAQTAAWRRVDPARVDVTLRPLQYLDGYSPREKGIDVQLAIDFVVMAMRDEYDIGVLFSTDTDLKPPLEAVFDLNGPRKPWPRTAGWDGPNHQKRAIKPRGNRRAPCLWLDMPLYYRVCDKNRYVK